MVSVRDQMSQARERLHAALAVKALYVYGPEPYDPLEVTVRVHDKYRTIDGPLAGFPASAENVTSLILLNSDFASRPAVGGYFSLSETEAYSVAVVHPAHGTTTEVEVARLSAAQITARNLPVPEDA